jgi:hypothetical protein
MPVVPMRVDTAAVWKLGVAGAVAVVALLVSLIVGLAGPAPMTTRVYTAYNCKDPTQHTFDPATCNGTQLGGPQNISWRVDFGPLTTRNREWALTVTPFRKQDSPAPTSDDVVTMEVSADVSVLHRDDPHKGWVPEVAREHHAVKFKCHTLRYQGRCRAIGAVYKQTIAHAFYVVHVTPHSHDGRLGDVEFDLQIGSTGWTDLELALNVVLLVAALVGFLVLLFALKRHQTLEWSFEQGCVLVLQFFLIFYNNPVLALEFLIPGWFLLFLGSFLKTLFVAVLLLFWLLMVEKIHRPETFRLLSIW